MDFFALPSATESGPLQSVEDLNWSGTLLLDVRSPAEFAQAHLPGAINLPLLSDEERARVGRCYKQEGRNAAVILGLHLVGARLGQLAEVAIEHCRGFDSVVVYCWRGGERSARVQWVLHKGGVPGRQQNRSAARTGAPGSAGRRFGRDGLPSGLGLWRSGQAAAPRDVRKCAGSALVRAGPAKAHLDRG